MSTLLLRLAAPLQAWGVESKYEIRQSAKEPSRSGVIGMIACAMGIRRDDARGLERLNQLRFGVRVDREGKLLKDYHIAKQYKKLPDDYIAQKSDDTYQTIRYYLSDAVFLAAVESTDDTLISEIDEAIRHPVFPLYLGRKSCPPTLPVSLGVKQTGLRESLMQAPWLCLQAERQNRVSADSTLRCVVDAVPEDLRQTLIQDCPKSYSRSHRVYDYRAAAQIQVPLNSTTPHDIMAEVASCT